MQTLILQAYMLLVMASGLLTQVQNTPNVSPEMRKVAETTAKNAISFATQIINNDTSKMTQIDTKSPIIADLAISTPQCAEIPTLTLATTSSNGSYLIRATYQTGCELNPNTKWHYLRSGATYGDEDSGVIGTLVNSPYVFARIQGSIWDFTYAVAKPGQPFVLTVGDITESI